MLYCDRHGNSNFNLVCKHLLTGVSRQWHEVPDDDEPISWWLCPECFQAYHDAEIDPLSFMPMCSGCVGRLRRRSEQGRNMAESRAQFLRLQRLAKITAKEFPA
jgi:hypothetical protein